MPFAWLLLAAGLLPLDGPFQEQRVALVEVNHYYDENGRHVFDQLLFYDWDADASRYQVRAWRLLKCLSSWPRQARGEHVALFVDGDLLRRVRAEQFRQTWTQFDPELIERGFRPREDRTELNRVRPPLTR